MRLSKTKRKFISLCLGVVFILCQQHYVQAEDTGDAVVEDESQATLSDAEEDTAESTQSATVDDIAPVLNYIDIGEKVDYYTPVGGYPSSYADGVEAGLPSSYDSRNESDTGDYARVTSVKDQNPYGTCWAFAALGALESSMLSQHYVADASNIDLSEYQFSYFFYNYAIDALGNLRDDITTALESNWLDRGNNSYYTMFALASWCGVADESVAPYEDAGYTSVLDDGLANEATVHMQDARVVSMQNSDDVKKLIMDNGSVVSGVYVESTGYGVYGGESGTSYYQSDSEISNHAILIVGWDDAYSVDNFSTTPSGDGAWLIKNSWGSAYYPYLWVSYYDACLSQADAFAFYAEPASNYDFNYQYDGCEAYYSQPIYNGDWISNVYTVSGARTESLDAVSIALNDDNVSYSVQIYLNPPAGNPLGGTPLLSVPVTGQTTYVGYYTIPIDEDIRLSAGDQFAVVFTLSDMDENDGSVYCFIDASSTSSWIRFDSYTEGGWSYYYNSNTGCVYDFAVKYDINACARIKAFTTMVEDFTAEDFSVSVPDQKYTGTALTPEPVVTLNGTTLIKGTDYTLSYENNTQIGTAVITVKGIGDYAGKKTVTFKIISPVTKPVTVYNGVDYGAVYDYDYYISNNQDIWKTYGSDDMKVLQHFVTYGMKEGRQGKSTFDVYSYAYKYADLRRAYKNDLQKYYMHYINYGKKEGRTATGVTTIQNCVSTYGGVDYSAVYNGTYYYGKYSDLRKAYGLDDEALLKHFINYGMKEGRQGKSTFDVYSYAYKYADLRRAYKNDLQKYYMHYINYGKKEGRTATGVTTIQNCVSTYGGVDYSAVYNGTYYYGKYSDLRKAYGLDDEALLKHFINYGMKEGRQANASFNVTIYKNRYADLRTAYGNDLKQYYLHYIKYGLKEGRTGK